MRMNDRRRRAARGPARWDDAITILIASGNLLRLRQEEPLPEIGHVGP